MQKAPKKIVVAYSGGLDTSVMVHWLKREYGSEIVAYCADVGQAEELHGLREKALATGASEVFIEDLREELVGEFLLPAIQAGAVYERQYLLGTALARPVIARRQVEIARRTGADAVAHGATGKGNDQVRFELAFAALAPELTVLAPWRTWPFRGRSELIAYAKEYAIPVSATLEKPYSIDRNLMHCSFEGGVLEDPWAAPPPDMRLLTADPKTAPETGEVLTIEFAAGLPVAVDGLRLQGVALFETLNARAGKHGVGRIDLVENRYVGIKSRGVYETPAGTVLHAAHRALETITMDREAMQLKDSLQTRIAGLIYNGFWFSPEFAAVMALVQATQKNVTGTVRLELYKGGVQVLGRKSPLSLFSPALATFEKDEVYDQSKATGFIELTALRLKSGAQLQGGTFHGVPPDHH